MSDDRLPLLIDAYFEGTLDDAGRAELNELLRREPAARSRFAFAMRQETLVGEILRDARSKPATARRSARRYRRLAGSKSAVPWIAGLAACVLLALAVLFASQPPTPAPAPVVRKTQEPAPAPPPPPPERPSEAPAPKPERVETPPPKPPDPPPPPRPDPKPKPAPVIAEAPPPQPPPPPLPPTVTVLATVKSGDAVLLPDRKRIGEGDGIAAGQGLEGRATVVYTDATRIELDGAIRAFTDRDGKRVEVAAGIVRADVAKQPAGRSMIFATPHAEARVLGTSLRLVVDGASTRLEVREGKVRLTRLSDGKSVDVGAGFYALAAAGVEMKTRALPANRPLDLDESLIGHWKLDEGRGDTIVDSSFGASDGTVLGAAWVPGRFGAALRFDGADDVVLIEGRLPFPRPALTVAAWVRHESLPSKVQRYVVVRSDVDLAVLRHDGANSPKQLDFFVNSNGFRHLRANDALSTGGWLHVAGAWDGAVQRLYLNGAEIARQDTSGPLAAKEARSVWISVARESMHGSIDDVRLYNRALSEREIADLAGRKP